MRHNFNSCLRMILIVIFYMLSITGIVLTAMNIHYNGSIPSMTFLCLILGFCFLFPEMLQDKSGGFSTIRVLALAVVMVFSVYYIKKTWEIDDGSVLNIDTDWVYILGLAFGAKVIQKFGEAPAKKDSSKQIDNADSLS